MAANAQTTFTQRLQKSNAGEGKVTVTQSKEIDDLVNGPQDVVTPARQTTQPALSNQGNKSNQTTQSNQNTQKQPEKQTEKREAQASADSCTA